MLRAANRVIEPPLSGGVMPVADHNDNPFDHETTHRESRAQKRKSERDAYDEWDEFLRWDQQQNKNRQV